MDFAKPHTETETVVSKSGLRLLKEITEESKSTEDSDEPVKGAELDLLLQHSANEAARDMILLCQPGRETKDGVVNCSLYTERSTPRKDTIQMGDLVVIFESFKSLSFTYVEEKKIYSNRNGNFHHKDFVGQPFGSKVRSRDNRGYGFIYLLRPTPELWARSLNHRTQIVHELDQSQVIFQLYLGPNMTVVESGTGSGAMSHAILRSIAPAGHLHTFEFNEIRAEAARKDFESNGVGHLVTVRHRDVCAPHEKQETAGFDLPEASVDAMFLDLPEPWVAIPHAAFCLKTNGRIASYSPCVEQTQRVVAAMRESGFHSVQTMEYRLQEHYVDEIEYEAPPRSKRPKYDSSSQTQLQGVPVPKQEPESEPVNETTGKMVVARPFPTMRGHTAFLTFATVGLIRQPDPNESVSYRYRRFGDEDC